VNVRELAIYKKLLSRLIYYSINSINSNNIYNTTNQTTYSINLLSSLQFSTYILIYILQTIIMRFNIAMLFALAATTQLTTATPMPVKWNDKDMEAGYVSKCKLTDTES
jgi:hypothetical protein